MPATTSRLRPLLPKTPSMTQPEPFLLSRTMEREGNLGELSAVSGAPEESESGQQFNKMSRRTRSKLAGEIEDLLDIEGYKGCHRSRAQTLRRKVEQGEQRLKLSPECDPTLSLDQALDHEYDVNQFCCNDRYRESYRSRMLRYEDEVRRGVYAEEQRREMMATNFPRHFNIVNGLQAI
ncbi:hypothetical protein R3P38DRAFT_3119227 [Favolaschia claudopus]|uniref:Uncharacterized protein n=1 Tax=Favolaschia claudopus TaxID=2862362 RepID=A0AAV9ZDC7_9AGAR